jgi:hypothetical protein
MLHIVRLLVLVTALVGSTSRATRAQDGTPAAGLVSVPAACDVEPRSIEEIIALFPETAATPEQGGSIGHAAVVR